MTRIRAALAAAFLVVAVLQLRSGSAVVRVLLHPDAAVGLPFQPRLVRPALEGVTRDGTRVGLREGDTVVAVGDAPFTGRDVLYRALASRRPGDVLWFRIQRDGAESRVAVPLPPRFDHALTGADWAMALIFDVATPVFCLLLGFGVAAIRPRDKLAWLLLWLMLSFSRVADSGTAPLLDVQRGALAAFFDAFFGQTWSAGMLLFGVLFPERLEFDRRRPWAKWLLLAPLLLLALLQAVRSALAVTSFARAAPLDSLLSSIGQTPLYLGMLGISLFFTSIGIKWGRAKSPDSQRRLRLLLAGSTLALAPPFLVLLASIAEGRAGFASLPSWAIAVVLLCFAVFPLTLAYVIVVERAMDVRVVIRQGLQYAFARNGITAARIVVSALIGLGALTLALDPNRNPWRKSIAIAAGLIFVALVDRGAKRLLAWTDRRFFREAYDAERILMDLSDRVRTMLEEGPLLETVTRTISESLHVPEVRVLRGPDIPAADRLRRGEVVRDRATLDPLGTELLLPLSVRDKLLGALSLGPKLSEEPYSPSDVRLLRSVAAQTSVALENSRLMEVIAADVARRERQNRELEIAREVQEQLFPQSYPALPGADMAGFCRPARGVGGDYYDFLSLSGGRVGIAIGDISGKGIPAALLMAGLQASLRSQAISAPPNLTTLMSNLNRLTCESSPSNRYATFFYGEYDPAGGRLVYVNAGHNAPMLFRPGAGPAEAVRLDQGGPVIGLLEVAAFQQGEVALGPGDTLVGFTDGVSEAMNSADEEWGEERLAETVLACHGLAARAAIDRIMQAADAFVAGAPQHDDMTLIVVRLLAGPTSLLYGESGKTQSGVTNV